MAAAAEEKVAAPSSSRGRLSKLLQEFGWDLMLGSIAAFYAFMVPYTKVEESFNYDHLDFPGVVPRTFIGAFLVSIIASPVVAVIHYLHVPKIYSLLAVRLALGFIVLLTLRLFRLQVRRKFGYHVEAFFAIMTALQFHLLFYSTRPLPNILAFCLGRFLSYFEMPGISVLVDSIMWQRILWPELEVFWFNSVLNRSSEWGTHPLHWYFTSALPRSMLVGYPLCMIGMVLDRRIRRYVLPVFLFILFYSKLPHKELRFILGSIPILNASASIAASRVYNNRKKKIWSWIYVIMLGSFIVSVGCSIVTFMASYNNYPGGYALKALHQADASTKEKLVHIDAFTAMNGVSRFSENEYPWRYCKEEGIPIEHFGNRNFTYLLNEHHSINGYKCLFAINGFSGLRFRRHFPPLALLKEPKVFIHGNIEDKDIVSSD
ncbi:Dol-P-Man:Man(7)GlcNAc(2)-PP-Dol alpha-1,6-mannosyltransferase [Ananas comosus]|uniref:Mannosyltransferase n=1 Tax=Ananas comosus TaxID=4615 RepID=A0A199VNA2_ANACO|nr:Dol-P-Man:Man(7)GlcNAc(2)-PP-Dol alpha-1,6-mannosyltransferase [Ananas comosus]